MYRIRLVDWLLLFAVILIFVIKINAEHRQDVNRVNYDRLCNNTKTENGRMHMSRCMVEYSPKKFLIMMEFCKKKIFGHVKFDQVLVAYCDSSQRKLVGKWHECKRDYAKSKYKTTVSALRDEGDNAKFIKLAMKCLSMDLKDYD